MAPEQLEMKPPTPLSDLFALGVVTYEALTRRRPFHGATEGEVVEAIRKLHPAADFRTQPRGQLRHQPGGPQGHGEAALAPLPQHARVRRRVAEGAAQRAAGVFRQPQNQAAAGARGQELRTGRLRIRHRRSCPNWKPKATWIRRSRCCAARWIRRCGRRASARCWKARGAFSRPPSTRWRCARSRRRWIWIRRTRPRCRSRTQVEKERREKKISEWITLARQHLDNQAFRQAREALDNVLQAEAERYRGAGADGRSGAARAGSFARSARRNRGSTRPPCRPGKRAKSLRR